MINEHGDFDFKEDELDAAIKAHARTGPPSNLVDCCLSTVPSSIQANELASPTNTAAPHIRRRKTALIRWLIAASIVVGTGGAYIFYDYETRIRHDASTLAQLESARQSQQLTITYGSDVDSNAVVIRDAPTNTLTEAFLCPSDATAGVRGANGLNVVQSADSAGMLFADGSVVFRSNGKQVEGVPVSRLSREHELILLREQLKSARETNATVQLDTQQSYIELKGTYETLEQRAAEVEARRGELEAILLPRGVLEHGQPNSESYAQIIDNPFLAVEKAPLSTFSTDVDTASFSNVRRFLNQNTMPPHDAVRIEELLNYFSYSYPQPEGLDPFSVNLEVAGCPWNGEHRLVRIGLKGREIADQQRPPASLVFLVDVSGSMQPANKLPLLKSAMKMLVQRLGENERVAIVTYSHELRLVLPSTTCDSKETIVQALDSLQAAGSTNGAGGIQLAYQIAVENFIQGGVNRVILATDGDFNVGITDRDELTRFIEEKARTGVFLSVLGFGMGNLKDATLERLADRGNGHFAYIDTIDEARKVLVDQLSGTLVTIAKDVKLQIELNPRTVSAYRLIGYENRVMAAQDFNDDRKDAGDIGAGHTVTALYEIVPAGKSTGVPGIDPLKYQPDPRVTETRRLESEPNPPAGVPGELLTVKLRYKQPDGSQSKLLEVALTDSGRRYSEASVDFRFASAVAAFGMILRDSPYRGTATLAAVLELAQEGLGPDREGYRGEFLKLVRQAQSIQPR